MRGKPRAFRKRPPGEDHKGPNHALVRCPECGRSIRLWRLEKHKNDPLCRLAVIERDLRAKGFEKAHGYQALLKRAGFQPFKAPINTNVFSGFVGQESFVDGWWAPKRAVEAAQLLRAFRNLKPERRAALVEEARAERRSLCGGSSRRRPRGDEAGEGVDAMTSLPEFNDPDTLFVVDVSGFVMRYWHAQPGFAGRSFVSRLEKIIALRSPARVALAEDNVWPTFRHELRPDYKAGRRERETGAERASRLEQLRIGGELAEDLLGVRRFSVQGFEGDDIIATLATTALEDGLKTVILGFDKDFMQLVSPGVMLWDGTAPPIGAAGVFEKLGVEPRQVVDFMALVGDKDEVPGIAGIGPVAAKEILDAFPSLDGALSEADALGPGRGGAHPFFERKPKLWAKLVGARSEVERGRKLARLRRDVPLGLDSLDELKL